MTTGKFLPRGLLIILLVFLTPFNCDYLFDIEPPRIEIIKPEKWASYFGTLPIELKVTDNRQVEKVEIFFDDESAHIFAKEPFARNFDLTDLGGIPQTLKVVAHDRAGNWSDTERDMILSLGFRITSPNGGEIWPAQSTQTVTWDISGNVGTSVSLDYSLYGGASWSWNSITDKTPNSGSYTWALPTLSETKTACRVRVASKSTYYSDISNNDFTMTHYWNTILIGSYEPPDRPEDVFIAGDYAYVASRDSSLQIIDISNPASPTLAGSYPLPDMGFEVFIAGNYAYLASYAAGLRIIDITDPASPTLAGYYDTPGYSNGVFVAGNYAYIADYGRLEIIDISNPAAPALAGSSRSGRGFDVFVSGSYAYVADGQSGLRIIDISNPASPTLAGYYDTPGNAIGVFVSGSYAYVADYDYGGLQIIDVSNPASPTLAGSCDTPGEAVNVFVSGDYAYVADYGQGLQIINVSNPATSALAGSYNTLYTVVRSVFIADSYAYAAESTSLLVIDISGLP
ncbi:MAG: hypothetical protein ACETWG_00535 [Candidatus Neomarinimicrobiota bacterium]